MAKTAKEKSQKSTNAATVKLSNSQASASKNNEKKPVVIFKDTQSGETDSENSASSQVGEGRIKMGDSHSSDESEDEEDEDEDVDQEGMERLVNLLGEDGLDDFDRAQLESLAKDYENETQDEEESGDEESGEEFEIQDEEENEEEERNAEESEAEDENESSEDDGDPIPLDEVESVDDDAVPKQKLEIDNKIALDRIRETIKLDPSLPWTETLVLTYPNKIEVDVSDDLNRELAFYKQALHSAQQARTLATRHNFPFTRPSDYFAEMVKSDAHMERIRQRLLNESASIKKSEEKRKEREGKKFGKQVQMEKLKERERSKKEMEERLKNLKRKRKDILDNAQKPDEDFDVAVEDAISDRPAKRSKSTPGNGPRMSRQARNKKFGFGSVGRRSKQNTKESTDSFGPRVGKGKKGSKASKQKRPGKSRRIAARSKS